MGVSPGEENLYSDFKNQFQKEETQGRLLSNKLLEQAAARPIYSGSIQLHTSYCSTIAYELYEVLSLLEAKKKNLQILLMALASTITNRRSVQGYADGISSSKS